MMMEQQQPGISAIRTQADKKKQRSCGNPRILVSMGFLLTSQMLKIAYFVCICHGIGKVINDSRLALSAQVFNVTSMGCLTLAYTCELYFWMKLQNRVYC